MIHFRLWLESNINEVPSEPGSTPVPQDHVRLYHYINLRDGTSEEQALANVRQNGIDIKKARGSTYGEPNVVWGSTQMPHRGKIFIEFSVSMNDPRWGIGRPKSHADVDWLHKSGANVTFSDSIRPDEIIAIHLPWHGTYRYLIKHNMIDNVKAGEYDHLLDKPESDEARAIQYIKSHA
jgi:hypothetical protein